MGREEGQLSLHDALLCFRYSWLYSDAQPPPGGVMETARWSVSHYFPPPTFLHLFFQSIFGLQRKNTHRRFIEWLQTWLSEEDRWELSSHTLRVFFTLDTSHLDPLHYTRSVREMPHCLSDSKLFADWALFSWKIKTWFFRTFIYDCSKHNKRKWPLYSLWIITVHSPCTPTDPLTLGLCNWVASLNGNYSKTAAEAGCLLALQ